MTDENTTMSHDRALEGATALLVDPTSLSAEERAETEAHLAACPSCREAAAVEARVWEDLGELGHDVPAEPMRRRVEELVRGFRAASPEPAAGGRLLTPDPARWRSSAPALALAAATLALGLAVGWLVPRPGPAAPSVTDLQRQVGQLEQLVALSLLQQDSATARLQGVAFTSRQGAASPDLVPVLVETLRSDPNDNVRLAAVEALSGQAWRQEVRRALVASLPEQESPLVQIALVDLLSAVDGPPSRRAIQQLLERDDLLPEVRQHALRRLGRST